MGRESLTVKGSPRFTSVSGSTAWSSSLPVPAAWPENRSMRTCHTIGDFISRLRRRAQRPRSRR